MFKDTKYKLSPEARLFNVLLDWKDKEDMKTKEVEIFELNTPLVLED